MPPTLTEDALSALQAGSDTPVRRQSPFDGLETEHIYIGDERDDPDRQPNTVVRQVRIRNFSRGVASELTYYREGFLRVREGTRKQLEKDHTIELRFVDPAPAVKRCIASGWLWLAILLTTFSFASWVLLPISNLAGAVLPATVILGTAAAIAFLQFMYRSEERIRFVTANGRAEVVHLVSSFGCIAKVRRAAREIRSAIAAAADAAESNDHYLRAEMQAHYRLRESGVISAKDCSEGTARILSRFG